MADFEIRFEPSPRRVRVELNGTWVADSSRAVILHTRRAGRRRITSRGRT